MHPHRSPGWQRSLGRKGAIQDAPQRPARTPPLQWCSESKEICSLFLPVLGPWRQPLQHLPEPGEAEQRQHQHDRPPPRQPAT